MKNKFNQEDEEEVDLDMDWTILEEVDAFEYLWSVVGVENEITIRLQAGGGNLKKYSEVLCDRKMPMKLKSKIHRTTVRPAREEKRLDVNEMRMLRWTCGVTKSDRIVNRHIRGTMKLA